MSFMKFVDLHTWDIKPKEAIRLQNNLKDRIILKDNFVTINTVAGADISLSKQSGMGFAGVIVYKYPELIEIERVSAREKLQFPYIPGLLSFREAPLLLNAFAKLKTTPDAVLFDGQGIAHPRRIGIASHMGLWLGIPTIGCAKSRLTGKYKEPDISDGSFTYLYDRNDIIGAAVRTRTNIKPVFISPGHLISLKSAIEITLGCTDGLRIPKPTREADKFVGELKR